MKKSTSFLSLLVLLLVVGCPEKPRDLTPEELLQQGLESARQIIAKDLNVDPQSLVAIEPVVVTAPLSGEYFFEEKFLEPKSGKVVSVPLGRNMQRYNVRQLVDRERRLFQDRSGKLEPSLQDSIARLGPMERVRVAIWLQIPDGLSPDRGKRLGDRTPEELKSILKRRLQVLEQMNLTVQDSLVSDLRLRDVRISYQSKYAPVVFCELTAEQIKSIAQRQDVLQINLGRTYEEEHDSAIPTLRANNVQSRGINGSGC